MAYLACDADGSEFIYNTKPMRDNKTRVWGGVTKCIELPPGSIAKLIGRELTWEDEPYELK